VRSKKNQLVHIGRNRARINPNIYILIIQRCIDVIYRILSGNRNEIRTNELSAVRRCTGRSAEWTTYIVIAIRGEEEKNPANIEAINPSISRSANKNRRTRRFIVYAVVWTGKLADKLHGNRACNIIT